MGWDCKSFNHFKPTSSWMNGCMYVVHTRSLVLLSKLSSFFERKEWNDGLGKVYRKFATKLFRVILNFRQHSKLQSSQRKDYIFLVEHNVKPKFLKWVQDFFSGICNLTGIMMVLDWYFAPF